MNNHELIIRAAALSLRLRGGNAESDQLIEAAEAFAQLECDHHAEITARELVQDERERVKRERDELAAHCRELSKTWLALDDCEEESAEAGEHTNRMRNLVLDNQELSSGHSLARRDALMKAEALEDLAAESFVFDADELRDVAAEYRKQYEGKQ